MSRAKQELEEAEERGWNRSDRSVCAECVGEPYLQQQLSDLMSSSLPCDYCGKGHSAQLNEVLEMVAPVLFTYFSSTLEAGVPSEEGSYLTPHVDIYDALASLPLPCGSELFQDVADAFHNDAWVPCDRHWLHLHESDLLLSEWDGFSERVKHHTRYLLAVESSKGQSWNGAGDFRTFLDELGKKVVELGLVTRLNAGCTVYRARHAKEGQIPETFDELGPPPRDKAIAGRMNPAGISYFYLAKERSTAIGEILAKPPALIAVGQFRLQQDCWILDLTNLPDAPSLFDLDQYSSRQSIVFLNEFVEHISMPITKDGREHVDYVPSQVVSEFFAQVFSVEHKRIQGMIYPSALIAGGNNLVLFPPSVLSSWENGTELVSAHQIRVNDWKEFGELLRPNT